MAGRTHPRWLRIYMDGYDVSGYARSIGPLKCAFEEGVDDALSLAVKGCLPGNANISVGILNGIFDNTATSGLHIIAKGAGVLRTVMVAVGIGAEPANNDPIFCGQFEQAGYSGNPGENVITASIPFSDSGSARGESLLYGRAWGALLHAKAAAIAPNSAIGLDQLAQTAKGGFMCYQVVAGNGTAAIKVQDADTNSDGSFADLLSSGTIDCASVKHGIVTLDPHATVKRYVRWQIALGTATTVTFALGWVRGN